MRQWFLFQFILFFWSLNLKFYLISRSIATLGLDLQESEYQIIITKNKQLCTTSYILIN